MALLEERTVLVTGAGRGIGRGVAEALAAEGAAIAVLDLERSAAEETAESLRCTGGQAAAVAADVTDPSAFEEALAGVVSALGACDGLVNNAGLIRMSPALDASEESFDRQLAVNTRAVLSCSRTVARFWIDRGVRGSIVNVASNAGKVGYPNMAGYNASKAAVISLTRSLAAEWAEHGINVNAVCPGGVDTRMLTEVAEWIAPRVGEAAADLRSRMFPAQLGRHVEPIEIGHVVAFLLSDRAAAIRGQAINVDGGDTPY